MKFRYNPVPILLTTELQIFFARVHNSISRIIWAMQLHIHSNIHRNIHLLRNKHADIMNVFSVFAADLRQLEEYACISSISSISVDHFPFYCLCSVGARQLMSSANDKGLEQLNDSADWFPFLIFSLFSFVEQICIHFTSRDCEK